jgi:hypothetical protein
MNVTHKLKVRPMYYMAIANGSKPFEIRKDDRNFQVGDKLLLQEWSPNLEQYTGKEAEALVTYITDFNQIEGYVVMGIRLMWARSEQVEP